MDNLLLDSLTAADRQLLGPSLAAVSLSSGPISSQVNGRPMAFFPSAGLFSVRVGDGTRPVESALVGREGLIGAGITYGRSRGLPQTLAYCASSALSLPVDVLNALVPQSSTLQEALKNYNLMCLEQASRSLYSASRCSVEQRLAGWLIMAFDRLGRDEILITHDVLAGALGVRRPGVTLALHVLEGHHALTATRGSLKLRRLDLLELCAGEARRDVFYPSRDAADDMERRPPPPNGATRAAEARP